MSKKVAVPLIILLIAVFTLSCAVHMHTIGSGSQTGEKEQARQWYVLWGLVQINQIDTQAIAGGATDYEIRTEVSPLDFLINIPTSLVTVYSRTVTVTK